MVNLPMEGDGDDRRQKLKDILSDSISAMETEEDNEIDVDDEQSRPPPQGFCIECQDQEAVLFCEQCSEDFCEVCHAMLHRTGNRKKHTSKKIAVESKAEPVRSETASVDCTSVSSGTETGESVMEAERTTTQNGTIMINNGSDTFGAWIESRAKYIPLRLAYEDRKFLRLLEAAINVSEYTDKIDIISYSNKAKRIVHQIKDLCAILSGLVVASDYKLGQELFADRAFEDNAVFFQNLFEIGRRHKIMNPEKMRSAYGKLMYMLMDSAIPEVQDMLGFSCTRPIKTVYSFLESRNALNLLHHELVATATKEILPDGKTRYQVQKEIKEKERAIEILSRKFAGPNLRSEEIKHCLYSIGDNHAYLRANRDPCDKMLHYLQTYFHPNKKEASHSLAILAGRFGHRLTHTHETQYAYVNQTLNLWREILHEMFMLWSLSDADMLDEENPYRLRDTGQGLNRVQSCPRISREMHRILHRAQQKAGHWVGSSVIHLGDKNVANALMFIDKYNQVSRILGPICTCLDELENVKKNVGLHNYIQNTFGGVENCKKDILADFFRGAFDGSGADNFFDAGSCIDGRLTSAWNWCSQIEKKPYFPVFLLTGFTGFDGGGW